MKKIRLWSKLLLWLHLFVCLVWLYMFSPSQEPPGWMGHVIALSILGIQFTWGFTVGLIVGPSRKRRPLLWWSLLTAFLPLWVYGGIAQILFWVFGPLVALLYLAVFIVIVACETYGGVLLGVKVHSEHQDE
jgi:hypothetical protein